jgi:hypothetical protein
MGPCPYPTFIGASIDGMLVIAYMSQKIHRHPIEQRWRDESARVEPRVFPHPVHTVLSLAPFIILVSMERPTG